MISVPLLITVIIVVHIFCLSACCYHQKIHGWKLGNRAWAFRRRWWKTPNNCWRWWCTCWSQVWIGPLGLSPCFEMCGQPRLASGYVKIAIENGHLLWIYPLKMVMFHSYVKLPEGSLIIPRKWSENRTRIVGEKPPSLLRFGGCYMNGMSIPEWENQSCELMVWPCW